MATPPNARSRAQSHFKSSEQREGALRAEMEKERAAVAAKTARLRALRLAKEAEDKVVEDDRHPAGKVAKKAAAARKSVKQTRK